MHPCIFVRCENTLVCILLSGVRNASSQELLASGCSVAALDHILSTLRGRGEVLSAARAELDAANHSGYAATRRVDVLEKINGSELELEWLDPAKLVSYTLENSASLRALYSDAIRNSPPSEQCPWHAVVAFDEYTPGNKMKPMNARKAWVIAFSFLELQSAMFSDACWFIPMVVRTHLVDEVKGGFARIMKLFLRTWLFDPLSLTVAGVPVQSRGRDVLLYASISNVLGDGDGLRQAYDIKGAGAIKPCPKCNNVLRKGSNLCHRAENFVEISCADASLFDLASEEDFVTSVDECKAAAEDYAAGRRSKASLRVVEMSRGMAYNPHGFVADHDIRRNMSMLDCLTEDWVHGALQDGTVVLEARAFLEAIMPHIRPGSLEAYFKADWQFAKAKAHKGRSLHTIFKRTADDERDKSYIKPLASEMLSMYALLRHFAESIMGSFPELSDRIVSFRAACDVVDAIMAAKHSNRRDQRSVDALAADIERKVQTHMERHLAAYGDAYIRPKHHRMQHVAAQLRRDKRILDAFIIERIHNVFRRITHYISTTQRYEASLLAGAVNVQLSRLQNKEFGNALLGKTAPHPMFADVIVAEKMQCDCLQISAGDLVIFGAQIGRVVLCAASGQALFLYVQVCYFLGRVNDHAVRVQMGGPKSLIYCVLCKRLHMRVHGQHICSPCTRICRRLHNTQTFTYYMFYPGDGARGACRALAGRGRS